MDKNRHLRDGEPCGHPGCLNHITHPCEVCGRVAGKRGSIMPKEIKDNHLKLDYNWLKQDYVFDDQDLLTAHQDRGKLLELVEKRNQLLLEATGLAAFGKGKSESYDRIFDDFIKKVQEECPDLFKLESEAGK